MPIQEGQPAPDFSLKATDGSTVALARFKGQKNVVLYFYPKDDTPGCTKEACAFRDDLAPFAAKDAVILGVSVDDNTSHQAFSQKFNLNFPLLSDAGGAVSKAYDAFNPEKGTSRRVTVVIGKDGAVKKFFPQVNVDGHSQEVLAAL
ncbi:MAG TPA: peroxiredoxin [bacterium]|nr:peroxiredoxin [bacterium]